MKLILIASLSSILLSLGLAELAIRIIRPPGAEQVPRFVADLDLGFRRQENQRGFVYQRIPRAFSVRFRTNSLGLRDREHYREKDGKVRILTLGDSFTEGWGVEEEQAYPKVLEAKYLKGAEVWNAGVAAYGTDQEFILLKRLLSDAQPDIVVIGFYENDLVDNALDRVLWNPFYVKPLFRVQSEGLMLTNRAALIKQRQDADQLESSFKWQFKNQLEQSALIRLLIAQKLAFDVRRKADQKSRSENPMWARFNPYRVTETTEMKDSLRVTERILVEMNRLCVNSGATLVILYIPSAVEVVPGELERLANANRSSDPLSNYDPSKPQRQLELLAQHDGISFVHPDEVFRRVPQPEKLYLPDSHLRALGHDMVALSLARFLEQKGLVPVRSK